MSFNRNRNRSSGGGQGGGGGGGGRYSGGGGGGHNNNQRRDCGRDSGGSYSRSNMGGSTLNPWAGGSVPERGTSLLPTPGTGNILSQLTGMATPEAQAQLLMASNLLTKLLTPTTNLQSNASSLMNLSGLGSNYGNSSYSHNHRDDRSRNYNSHRSEPYNKSSLGRRNQNQSNSNKPRNAGSQNQNRRNRPSSSPMKTSKKSDNDSKEMPDKKRKDDFKKEPEERKDHAKEDKTAKDGTKTSSEFTGIPKALLYCYVCQKHMWDDSSFENHVKGRPHEWMLTKLDESNKLVVDLLRHQVRTNEEQRRMKFQRSAKKKDRLSGSSKCEFCAMCDVDIRGSLAAHRRNYLHLKLKKFLHPKCATCKKEFHNRLDFNLHKISADHLKALGEKRRLRRPDLKDDEYDLEDFIVLDDVGSSASWGMDEACITGEIRVATKMEAEEDIDESKVKGIEEGDIEMKEDSESKRDRDQDRDDRDKLPIYNPAAVIGKELMIEVTGKFCRACYRFMKTEEDASIHCRTVQHYENYRNLVKVQHNIISDNKRKVSVKAEGENGTKKEADDEDDEADYEEEDEDAPMENGKTDATGKEEEPAAKEVVEENEENNEEEKMEEVINEEDTKTDENEKYDPMEPTDESSDATPQKSEEKPKVAQKARRGQNRRGRS